MKLPHNTIAFTVPLNRKGDAGRIARGMRKHSKTALRLDTGRLTSHFGPGFHRPYTKYVTECRIMNMADRISREWRAMENG